ncbi:hypothetical protein M8756_07730 [Lutimaribacter sp. EGI FJ00015]|nr:hypothetical protein [Lutimaribacter sp. EGI FJ00015]
MILPGNVGRRPPMATGVTFGKRTRTALSDGRKPRARPIARGAAAHNQVTRLDSFVMRPDFL